MRSAVRFCLCVLIAAFCGVAAHSQSSQAATTSEKPANPLEMKAPGPGEEKAYKTFQKFQAMPESDGAKKTQAAEDFLNKFPTSSYASYVYSYLTVAYIQTGQIDKGLATGEKDLQVNPSDFRTMSVLSQTISRTVDDSTPDASTKLDKAQTYAKNAIAGAPIDWQTVTFCNKKLCRAEYAYIDLRYHIADVQNALKTKYGEPSITRMPGR